MSILPNWEKSKIEGIFPNFCFNCRYSFFNKAVSLNLALSMA